MSDMANQGILQQQKKLPPGARPDDLADLYLMRKTRTYVNILTGGSWYKLL